MKHKQPSEWQRWEDAGKDCYKIQDAEQIFGPKHHVIARFDWIFVRLDYNKRYCPQSFLFAMANPLPRDENGNPYNPVIFRTNSQILELFGLDAGGSSVEMICGELRDDLMKDTLVFTPAVDFLQTVVAPHVLLKVTWGGKTHGTSPSQAKFLGAVHFEPTVNNSGRSGIDYWVLPWQIAHAPASEVNLFKLNFATECFPEGATRIVMCKEMAGR